MALLTSCIDLRFTAAKETTIEQTKHKAVATITVLTIPSTGIFLNFVNMLFELDTIFSPSFDISHYYKMINQRSKYISK